MPSAYFVDTWFLIAIEDRFDRHHFRARSLRNRYGNTLLITHEAVLTEMLTFFSAQGASARAIAVEGARRALRDLNVISSNRDLFQRSLDFYATRPDKEYSLVDCMSMVVMRDLGITHVLTNDHHFQQEGFLLISE